MCGAQTSPVAVWQAPGGTLRWTVWPCLGKVQRVHVAEPGWGVILILIGGLSYLFVSSTEFGNRAEQFEVYRGTGKENMVGN